MNVSFTLLIVTLFGLAVLTRWNMSVIGLIVITLLLWCAMNACVGRPSLAVVNRSLIPPHRFIYQLNDAETNPKNAPPSDPLLAGADDEETRKDR